MKKKYFDRLSEELDKVNAKHKDDIIDKYKKRYDFGLESGMKEAEIEEMLGDPEEIAKKYAGDNPYTTDGFNKNYNLSIKTVSDDIVIKKTKDDKVHVYFDDCEEDKYNVKVNSDGVNINYPKSKFFGFNRKKGGTITVEIPEDRLFYNAEINTASGDIKVESMKAKKIEFIIASSDMVIHKLDADHIKLTTVSGDIFVDKVRAVEFQVSSVSGDVEANHVESESIVIDTISGDANIKETNGKLKTSSISGSIKVNGTECGNMKSYIKGMFKK